MASCQESPTLVMRKDDKNTIIERYLKNGAWQYHYLEKEWDDWISRGLERDSTIAILWQQKALPYWKQKKYELGIKYYNEAVCYDRETWLCRLGYLKCIFAKDYKGALQDLITFKYEFGSTIVQDHSIEFYMGLCYLQLNQFEKALTILKGTINNEEIKYGVEWVHYLDRYYLGIVYYELSDYQAALIEFDTVLLEYPNFSDAQYYKSLSLNHLGEKDSAKKLMKVGKLNYEKGYTFGEDACEYEVYPYQITWQWKVSDSILR